jgi:transcriptional regulator with XRE-family HTH domain
VSIGETLLAARQRAGLTVGDVSDETRIRSVLIRGIERDDFSGCGGDFYARGHIRAIANALGTDPRPLIEEYDAIKRTKDLEAAAVFAPSTPIKIRERRGVNWTAILSVLLLAVLGFAGYLYVSGSGHSAEPGRRSPAHRHGHGTSNLSSRSTRTPRASTSGGSGGASPGASTAGGSGGSSPGASTAAKTHVLAPVGATAFGPAGPGSGDDPGDAGLVIGRAVGTAWRTDWYATANFGGLQHGTGLLIDLGRPLTITAAEVTLGSASGADLQLRAGTAPALADLPTVAAATDAGGAVRLSLATPVLARYVLIWFTKLPPDSTGTFQASVYNVRIVGGGNGATGAPGGPPAS